MEGQSEIFEQAKLSIASELDEEILAWDFSKMLSEWRVAIAATTRQKNRANKNALRYFCRHNLQMPLETYKVARGWLSGKAVMPQEKIELTLRFLKTWKDESPTSSAQVSPREHLEVQSKPITPQSEGLIRDLINHMMTFLNSSSILMASAGVEPGNLYDGDRIEMRTALKEICGRFGIAVIFPEPEAARNQPLSADDLADFGLNRTGGKRRRA